MPVNGTPDTDYRYRINSNENMSQFYVETSLPTVEYKGVRRGVMGCYKTPSAASNTPSPPQQRSTFAKHPLQNTENDCHRSLSDSFRVHQIRFLPGFRPDPARGAYSAPQTIAGLREPYF